MASRKGGFDDMARRDAERLPTTAANEPSSPEKENRSKAKLRWVSVFKLQPHSLQPPERQSEENVADLLVSILELGLQNPPHVWRRNDGAYVILFGHRRIRAWQLAALDGRLPDKIQVFVRSDLGEGEALLLMAAEYFHQKEYSALHTARLIGEASRHLSVGLDGEITVRALAAVLPSWKKTSVGHYRAIYKMLQDPRLATLVHRVDKPTKALLNRISQQAEFSTRRDALQAYAESGAGAARKVLADASSGNGAGSQPTVTRSAEGEEYDMTIRLRADMTETQIREAEEAANQILEDLKALRGRRKEPRVPSE